MHTEREPKLIAGYDTNGTVYDAGDYILRKISQDYFDEVINLYKKYKDFSLDQLGIVKTELNKTDKTLQHQKHTTSYPYEWTANMFKDAVLFHLNLFLELDKYNLTLKDGHPGNIVFDNYKPVFVDFLSILEKDNIIQEKWLLNNTKYSDPRFAVFDIMFVPYILIPLLVMGKMDYAHSRRLLLEKACNSKNGTPCWKDLSINTDNSLKSIIKRILRALLGEKSSTEKYIETMYKFLKNKNELDFNTFCTKLVELVEKIDVTPPTSAYANYYKGKKENFNFSDQSDWQNKQLNVFKTLKNYNPVTVLDIGANTGWFSRLAEHNGAKVISVEIDESSVDKLYLEAKKNNFNILPLRISFNDFNNAVYGRTYDDPVYKDRDFKSTPLFLPATERLNSDMVMCLALIHHLILGEGLEIKNVIETLANLSTDSLILEFVTLDDEMIVNEPSFFKNLHKHTHDTYNIDIIINEAKKHFKEVEILESHPDTRRLIVLKK